MSVPLPTIDLSSASVGFSNGNNWANQLNPSKPTLANTELAHVRVWNESAFGIFITFPATQDTTFLAAGQWSTFAVDPAEVSFSFVVLYKMLGSSPNLLVSVYYWPWEVVDEIGMLGNSPIQVGSTTVTMPELITHSGRFHVSGTGGGTITVLAFTPPLTTLNNVYRISGTIDYKSSGGTLTFQVQYTDPDGGAVTQTMYSKVLATNTLDCFNWELPVKPNVAAIVTVNDTAATNNYIVYVTVEQLTSDL